MWFCVVGVVLPDILTCLQTRRQSFCVASAMLLRRFQTISCISRSRGSASETSIVILRSQAQRFRRVVLRVFANRNVKAASSGDTPDFPLYTQHFTFRTLHPHSTLYTLHSTLHNLHSTLHTLHFALHTLHFTFHTLYSALYTLHPTLSSPHSTLYTSHVTLDTSHFTLHILHSTLTTPHFKI